MSNISNNQPVDPNTPQRLGGGGRPADGLRAPHDPAVTTIAQTTIPRQATVAKPIATVDALKSKVKVVLDVGQKVLENQSSQDSLKTKAEQAFGFSTMYNDLVDTKKGIDNSTSTFWSIVGMGKEYIVGETFPMKELASLNTQIQEGLGTLCIATLTPQSGEIYRNQEMYRNPERFEADRSEIQGIYRALPNYDTENFINLTIELENFYGLENLTEGSTAKREEINNAAAVRVGSGERNIPTELEDLFAFCNNSITLDDLEDETLEGPFRVAGNKTKVTQAMEMFSDNATTPLKEYISDQIDRDDKIAFIKQLVKRFGNQISRESSPSLCTLIQRTIDANNPMQRGNLLISFKEAWNFLPQNPS